MTTLGSPHPESRRSAGIAASAYMEAAGLERTAEVVRLARLTVGAGIPTRAATTRRMRRRDESLTLLEEIDQRRRRRNVRRLVRKSNPPSRIEKPPSPRMPEARRWPIAEPPLDSAEAVILGPGLHQLAALVEIADVAGAAGNERHDSAAMDGAEVPQTADPSITYCVSVSSPSDPARDSKSPVRLISSIGRVNRTPPSIARCVDRYAGDATLKADSRTQLAAGAEQVAADPCPWSGCAGQLGVDRCRDRTRPATALRRSTPGSGVRRGTVRPGGRGRRDAASALAADAAEQNSANVATNCAGPDGATLTIGGVTSAAP